MKSALPKIPRLIWTRLPWIILYAVAITGALFLYEFAYYRYSDGTKFINYSSFRFNSVEEHQDVPFEACKVTDFEYKIQGNRKIYRIPEGKTEIDKVQVKTYPLDSIISKTPCVNAFITKEQYDFTAGNYQVYTTFNFRVKYGNEKSVTFKSNVFTILPSRPATVEEIQKRIEELQKEIDLLKLQLAEARESGMRVAPAQTTPHTNNATPDRSATAQTPKEQPKPKPQPEPVDQGLLPNAIPIIGRLL